MCGICAIVGHGPADAAVLAGMNEAILHRGPDSGGQHLADGVGLAMRRLRIIDLAGGEQPIYSADGRVAIVFNGEIYNFRELRRELEAKGFAFRTNSDTEAVLHCYLDAGPEGVRRLRGMFAFAIHDRRQGRVLLARDRLGIKPLYYTEVGGALYAASEPKSLLAVPGVDTALDPVALDQYLSLLYVPAPRSIFRAIHKLPPAHLLIKEDGRPPRLERYWRLDTRPAAPRPEDEVVEELRARFEDAVRCHLIADVPLGVFLSGGLDSTAMVAAAARAGGTVRTFSLGFPEAYRDFDERPQARLVAQRYGTRHEEMVVEPRIGEVVHRLARVFCEPLGDSGAVPNLLICAAARSQLTVALSGLGGDELLGGYERHLGGLTAEWYRRLPAWLRHGLLGPAVDRLPEPRRGARFLDRLKRFVRHADLPPVERFCAFSSALDPARRLALYSPEMRARVEGDSALDFMRALAAEHPEADAVNRLLLLDLEGYMVDDLLAVADRTSMAVSLEVRVPFLDHPLVEFLARLPGSLKIRRLQKKYLSRRAFGRDLPGELLRQPKRGFSLPIARWLREDLRELLEDVLSPARVGRRGWLDPRAVAELKREHFERRRNWSGALWGLLMLELWADNYLPPPAGGPS
jgi:asparagine synthase (glutamine-hydrolysing)